MSIYGNLQAPKEILNTVNNNNTLTAMQSTNEDSLEVLKVKIIEQGKKIEAKSSEKIFKCTCCNCKWTAEPNEYVMIRTPMKPNVYCWCPNCGNQAWEQED